MEWKKRISWAFTITCTSFTIIMVLYTLLAGWMDAPINERAIYVLFAVCAMTSVVIMLTNFIPINATWLRYLINFLDVFLTVFLFGGGVLGMFSFTWKIALTVFGMLTVAYGGVIAVILLNEQLSAANINNQISEMKHKNKKLR